MTSPLPGDFEPTEAPADTVPTAEPTSIFTKKKPKSDTTPKTGAATRGRPNKHNQRKEKLMTILITVGTGVAMFEQFDGMVIATRAEDVAEATATLADEVPAVAKALDAMSTGGAYGAFLMALMSMLLPILAHHKVLPAAIANMIVPDDVVQ